jgi:hypothetical protein
MATVKDFKDSEGNWVYRFYRGDERLFTRCGMLFHALKQRVNPYGKKQQQSPLYAGCYSSFRDFQDFADWCQDQAGFHEGFHLDKDLLVRGNKEYGKQTCVFIPQQVNKLLTKRDRDRGPYPIGVTIDHGRFRASCNIGTGVAKYLGGYGTPTEAFCAYKSFKESYMKTVAEHWKDKIDPRAYNALMSYQVEITD